MSISAAVWYFKRSPATVEHSYNVGTRISTHLTQLSLERVENFPGLSTLVAHCFRVAFLDAVASVVEEDKGFLLFARVDADARMYFRLEEI